MIEPDNDIEYLSPREVAVRFNIPETSLSKWRSLKIGPPYRKLGKHIRYKPAEVKDWIERQTVMTT